MQLNDFTGGINNKQSPFLIASNEAIDLMNVDFDNSTLKPIKLPLNLGKTVKNFYFKYQGKEFQSDNHRNYVTKLNKLYWSDGINKAKKYNLDDNTEYNLGIDKPKVQPMVSVLSNNIHTIDDTNSPKPTLSVTPVYLEAPTDYTLRENYGDLPAGTYEYLVVLSYEKSNSEALKKTFTLSNSNSGIAIINIKGNNFDASYIKAKVYRLYKGSYKLVGTANGPSDAVYDTTFNLDKNEDFKDRVEFSCDYTYIFKAVYKYIDNLGKPENYTFSTFTGSDFTAGTYEYLLVHYYRGYTSEEVLETVNLSDKVGVEFNFDFFDTGEYNQLPTKIYRKYKGVYRLVGTAQQGNTLIRDDTLDISANEAYNKNTNYDDSNYGTIEVTVDNLDTLKRLGGFVCDVSSDNNDDQFVGIYRVYGNTFYKINDIYDYEYDLSSNQILPLTNALSGIYQYAYTYYNSKDGTESAPSEFSIEKHIINSSNTILLSNIVKSDDPQVDKIRLYRLGGTLTQWHLVQELDNKTQSFIDNYSDYILSDTLLDSFNNLPPVVGIKQLTYVHGYYIGFKDDKVWWSQPGNPNYWSPFNYIEFEDEVTGIGILPTGILVFLKNKTYIIQGTDPSVFVKFLISSTQGCIDYKSINYVNEKIIWLSNDGFCTSNGGEVIVISQPKLRKLENLNIINSVVVDSIYYLVLDTYILALDFRYNGFKIFKYDMNIKSLSYDSYEDKFYGVDKNNNLVEIFKSNDYAEFEYQSPYFSLTSISNVKLFSDIYIAFSGSIKVDVYIDGLFINSKEFEGGNFAQVKKLVTQVKQRGNYIQLIISGTGKVYEIEFKAIGRQNGK